MASKSWFFKSLTKEEFNIILRNTDFVIANEEFFDIYELNSAGILGKHYENEKNFPKAIDFFEKFLRLYRENFSSNPAAGKEFAEEVKKIYYNVLYELSKCYSLSDTPNYKKAFEYVKKVADEYDDAESQNTVGSMYSKGRGVIQDTSKAADYFEKAAVQGNMYAQNSLGRIYEIGMGRTKDLEKAIYWYKKASEQGDDLATENLMRLQGADVDFMGSYEIPGTDLKPANLFNSTKQKAEQGDFEKQCLLASYYLNGIFVALDVKKGLELLNKYANAGNPFAQYELGTCYNLGKFVKQNRAKAFDYFLRAARKGHVSAKYNVGVGYYFGVVVEQNVRKSFQWLLSAAEDGHPDAQFRMTTHYAFGIGCEYNLDKIIYWAEKAAEQDHYYAQSLLINHATHGILPNNVNAFKLLKKWTERMKNNTEGNKGYSHPIIRLGSIPDINDFDEEDKNYSVPETLIKNPLLFFELPSTTVKKISKHDKTKKPFREVRCFKENLKKALNGSKYSMYKVGECYQNGVGIDKDEKKAQKWFKKAADLGFKKAKEKFNS